MVKVTYQHSPRYENPLAGKLGLRPDDLKREGKLNRLLIDLEARILTPLSLPVSWRVRQALGTGALPLPDDWQTWPELTERTVWGETQKHTWLVTEIEVPEEARDRTLVLAVASNWRPMQGSTDPQCLAYLDGAVAQALDGNHPDLVIAEKAEPGQRHLVQINAFTFDERPLVGFQTGLFVRSPRVEALYHDLATAFEVAIRLPQVDGRRHKTLDLIERTLHTLDRRAGQNEAFEASLAAAEGIASGLFTGETDTLQPTISAFGHTHLDVAWLWRVKHVRDKTARSFATVLNIMDEFPEFIFMYNQAVLFDFLKQDYPEIWARLKDKVTCGQFEIEGAMWVEPDVNIASGEALVRQIMRGRQFHMEEFGVTPKCVWLPDTFGYSAALPQIMVASGIEVFITSKLSWNDTERHPYDSFFWRGIDGTRIKAQLITTQSFETEDHRTIYNSDFSVSDILGTWKRYEPKALNDNVLMCYGHGDGGGGPTRDMVQRGLRLSRGIPGAPNLRLEGLRPFLDRLVARMTEREADFPVWNGELYLQYHRGTLTSVAANKSNNRKAERAMRELEFAATMATLLEGAEYPRDAIRELWDIVLINQFHDILPGTSIAEVNADTRRDYVDFFTKIDSAQGPMAQALDAVCPQKEGQVWVLNTTGQHRENELVELADAENEIHAIETPSGHSTLQKVHRADGSSCLAACLSDLPSFGWIEGRAANDPGAQETSLRASPEHLENELVLARFNSAGEIASLIDKTSGRELLPTGRAANRLVAFEDKPKNYDAWDIDASFEDKSWVATDADEIEVIETGPHRAALRVTRRLGNSRISQIVSLQNGARQIEFDTEVDWQERQTLLKAEFPFDLNVLEVRAEIQFGHVKRATHRNTSWDQAKFEASMHRWVDISEPDFGAALLTDSKYGYDAHEQTVRLTLLKGPVVPDPDADLGLHRFRYALKVHRGEQDLTEVVRAAEAFNNPLLVRGRLAPVVQGDTPTHTSFSFVKVDGAGVTLETIKRAEEGDAVILRLFEHANRRSSARLIFDIEPDLIEEVDLMEQGDGVTLTPQDKAVELAFKPFEVRTLRIRFRQTES